MPLEPRIMYDGAAAASVAHHHNADHGADHHDTPGADHFTPPPAMSGAPAAGGQWQHNNDWKQNSASATGNGQSSGQENSQAQSQWHSSAPIPQVVTWVKNPTEIVFIDTQVSDYQALVKGANPGVEVVELNANSNGIDQIADFLSRHPDPNLTTIDLVAHGQDGTLYLGNAVLDEATLGQYTAQLQTIGAALQPGGEIALFACDVAQDSAGVQFISDLSASTGGADIAASSQNIGTLQATDVTFENWTLDVATGARDTGSPFTTAALANYDGILAGTTVTASAITTTLTVDADGDGGISPGDTVTSDVTITNTTSTAATGVAFTETLNGLTEATGVTITPIGVADSYTLVGNTPISENAANGVLANDIDFNGEAPTVSAVNGSAANVGTAIAITDGTLTLNANGSFTFTPTTGFAGTTSFTYTAHDAAAGDADQTTTVTLTVTAPVWYVDSAASATGADGSYAHPFQTVAAAVNAAGADTIAGTSSGGVDNTIFVENAGSTYSATSGIALASGEQLLGDGSSLTEVNGNSVGLSSNNPTFSVSSSGNAVTLSSNNTISGIDITNTGSGAGISNNGTTTGGNTIGTLTMSDIAVNTNSGTGISLTYDTSGTSIGGTVDVTGTGNTIDSTSGTALDITNIDIGSGGVTFKSISDGTDSGSSGDGIILDDTGLSGGLTVTGDGSTAGSGGTIENKTGSSATSGTGIYLNDTADVSIAYMQLNGFAYDGIYGIVVTNFSMDHTVVNGANGSAVGEGSVIFGSGQYAGQNQELNGLTGIASITNSSISGGYYDNVDVFDWGGFLNVTLNNDTFGDNNATTGNQNVYIDPDGGAVINATVTDSKWTGVAGGSNFYFDVNSTAAVGSNLTFTGNTVADNLGGTGGDGGSGIVEAIASSETGSTTTFDIENNSFNGANGTAVIIVNDLAGSSTTTALLDLIFNNNTIGSASVASSGSGGGGGLAVEFNGGTLDGSVTNNQIYQVAANGIDFTGGEGVSSGNENGTLNAEITGNTYEDPSAYGLSHGALQDGIYIDAGGGNPGASDNYVFNVTIGGTTTAEENTVELNPATFAQGSAAILIAQDAAPGINLTAENGSTTSFVSYNSDRDDANGQVESFLSTYNNTPDISGQNPNFAAPSNSGNGFVGGDPSAEAPATGPTFGTPTIAGTDTESATLTAPALGAISIYQWQEAFANGQWVDISGANSSSYTLTEAQVGATLRVVETSVYSDGLIDTVASAATSTVADHLTVTLPSFAVTAVVGQILTASTSTTDNSDATITYQWQANGVNISGATGQSFRVTSAQIGDTIDVVATATDPHGGDTSATSGATSAVTAFSAQSLSSVSIGTLPGNDKVTVSWEATVNAQSDQLIVNPTYTNGSVSGSNFTAVTVPTTTVALDTLSLEGEIFDDANGNGLLDAGESGIGNVSVSIFAQGSSTALETTSTNASGDYDFTGLAAGSYYVLINTLPSGFSNASPVVDTTPNDYAGSKNYGLALSGGVIDTNAITIAYDSPRPTGATSYPGDDTTDTLDIGLVQGPQVTAGGSATFAGGGSPVVLDSGLVVTDASSSTLSSATVTIVGAVTGDTLTVGTTGGLGVSFSNGTLTLTGVASLATYQTVLESVAYGITPSDGDPTDGGSDTSRTIHWTVSDGTLNSATVTSTLDTVHTAPTVTAAGTVTFTGGGSAVTLDAGLILTDVDSDNTLASATVTIASGYIAGDTLNFTNSHPSTEGNISVSSDSNGVLVLTSTGRTATVSQWETALESVTYSFSPSNGDPTGGGGDTSRTINWVVNDGSTSNGTSNSSTESNPNSTLDTVHVAPTVTAGGAATFDDGGSPVILDGTLTVTDPDSGGNLTSAAVSISSGFLSGDTLNFTNQNGISGSYDAVHGILTLTGTSSVADYQTALDSITFSSTVATAGTRTLTWNVNDGSTSHGASTNETSTVDVVSGPQISAGATATFDGGGSPVTLDGTLTVTDAFHSTLASATVSISSGFLSGDTLNFANQNGITGVYDATTGLLTLTGTTSLANYQTALDSITYSFSPTNGDPTNGGGDTSRTVSWSANNGAASSAAVTSTLDTVHVAPTVTAGGSATFTGGGSAVTLDGTLTLADVDSAGNLTSATVSVSSGFHNGDSLNFISQNGISGAYDASTGLLTLTGTSSVANYQTALDSITYSLTPSDGDPTASGSDTARTITWTVSDGSVSNGTGSATSTLDTVHVAPTVTSGGTVTFTGGGSAVTLDSTLTVSGVDSGGRLSGATVSISSGLLSGDTLNFTNQNGITGSYDSTTGTLTLAGTSTIADYQTALDSITYSVAPSNGDPTGGGSDTARTISWTVTDGSTSNGTSNTATSTLDTVHTAPTVTAGGTVTFNGGGSPVTLDSSLTVSDVDSGSNLNGATVSISSGFLSGDTLNFTNQNGISGSYDAVHGVLTLSGTSSIADYQAALDSISYSFSPSDGDPTAGNNDNARTISWTVIDGSSSNGSSNTSTSALDTTHTPPTVIAGASATFDGGGSPVTLDGTLTVTDPDSNGNLSLAVVTISSGFTSGDTLNFTNQNGISGNYDAVHGILTLTGTSSVLNYQTALDSVTYSFSPSNGDPTSGGGATSRTIYWTADDGSSSETAGSTLTVVHTAPAVVAGGTATFDGGGSPVVLDGTLTTTDADSGGNLTGATVSISAGLLSGDTLNFTNQNGITGSYDAVHGILTLTGTSSVTNYQTALDSITYSFSPSNGDPTGGGGDTSRTINWSVTDGSTSNGTSNTATSTLDTVHVAPTVTAGATATFELTGPAVTADGALTVTDPDSAGDLTGATVTITTGLQAANDVLHFVNQNGITGSYDSATGVLTLTGTATVADYQTAFESITFSSTTGSTGTRTLSWTVSDGSTSNGTSNTDTSTIDLVVGPQIAAGATATFNGGGSPVTLDGTLTVTDPAQTDLDSATVSISSNFLSGDVLNFTNQNGITGSYDALHGILTLTGTSSVANYQTALDSITYSFSPSNGDPTGGGGDTTRTISWAASDSVASSNTATSTLDTVHTAPTVTAGGTATFELTGPAVTADGTLTVTDPDSGGNLSSAAVTITPGFISGDTLNFTNQNGITGSYNPLHGILILTGTATVADYQAALDSITFSSTASTFGSRTLSWRVSDGTTSNSSNIATSTIDLVTGPQITAGATATFNGGGSPVTLDGTFTVTDSAQSDLTGATISIGTGFTSGDTLNFVNQNGISVSSYDAVHGILTLTGTSSTANYQTALDSITYSFSPTNGDPTAGGGDTSRTITWIASDSVASSNTATSTLDTVHTAPTVTAGGTVTFDGGGSAVTLDGTLTLNAPDSGGNLSGATVSIGTGFLAGDTLNFVTQNGITGSYDAVHGILTLTGTSSVANYQTALASIAYGFSPLNADPTGGGGDTARAISWTVTDGSTSNGTSNTAPSALNVVHVAPTVTAGATTTFETGGPAVIADGTLTVSDPDSSGNLTGATVSISSGFASGDALNFINQSGITGSYDAVHGILTLTGTSSVANYQAGLESITFSSTVSSGGTRTLDWVVNDPSTSHGTSHAANSTITTVQPTLGTIFVHNPVSPPNPNNPGIGAGGDFFQAVTNVQPVGGQGGAGFGFGPGNAIFPVTSNINLTIADNGQLDLSLALLALEAPLNGDVVEVTATLADGKPLPDWLHFDGATGKFAGLVPDTIATGSIPSNGGVNGNGLPSGAVPGPATADTITIEVTARSSNGDMAVTDFTIKLKPGEGGDGKHHTWNLPPSFRLIAPSSVDPHPHHALAVPGRNIDTGHTGSTAPEPAGRVGLRAQLSTLGLRGMQADRMALLESLRHAAGGRS